MFFSKKSVGIDIADRTIEIVEMKNRQVLNIGRILIPSGVVERGRIKNSKELAHAVRATLENATPRPIHTKRVFVGLPETQTYAYIIQLPLHDPHHRIDEIRKQALQSIPLEPGDLLYSYRTIKEYKDTAEVLIVAVSRGVVLEWQSFFRSIPLDIELFDLEILATYRGMFDKAPKMPVCIVDIGSGRTVVSVFDVHGLRHDHTIPVAGDFITVEVSRVLGVALDEAIRQKREIGLSNRDPRLLSALIKALEHIVKDLRETFAYIEPVIGAPVGEVVCVGGSARMPGLPDYFSTNLDKPVRLGGPLYLSKEMLEARKDDPTASLLYIEAIGLALRGFGSKDPAILPIAGKAPLWISLFTRYRNAHIITL